MMRVIESDFLDDINIIGYMYAGVYATFDLIFEISKSVGSR